MKIDYSRARAILEEECSQIQTISATGQWVDRIQAFSDLCRTKNKTMIAALGTAILAKATEPSVDVFSLQVGDDARSNTYSARALCKEVLAADANRLGIDLGVTGREPLNNQPFFGKPKIGLEMNVRTDAQAALSMLVEILSELEKISTERQARSVLRVFLQVRRRKAEIIYLSDSDEESLDEKGFLAKVKEFVGANSEGGKRAQAVATALLTMVYGQDLVVSNKVNDPSRRMPGDIGILINKGGKMFRKVFEVKDKPVTENDLRLLIDDSMKLQVRNICMLAVNKDQSDLDQSLLERWAESRQIRIRIFSGWNDFVTETLFWADLQGPGIASAKALVAEKLKFFDVSEEGQALWATGENN